MLCAFFQLGSWVHEVKSPSPAMARVDEALPQHLVEALIVAQLIYQIEAGDDGEPARTHVEAEDGGVLASELHEGLDGGLRPPQVEQVAKHRIPRRLRYRLVNALAGHKDLL